MVTVGLLAALALATPSRTVGMFLDDDAKGTRIAATRGIEGLGGHVVHAFDDVLVVALPRGAELRALALPGVRELALNPVPEGRGRAARSPGVAAWNAIARRSQSQFGSLESIPAGASPLTGDGLLPPAADRTAVAAAISAASWPFGATDLNTSEFLAGKVSVNVILVESDGIQDSSTENWTADREAAVTAEIAEGLEWIRQQEPQAGLSFVYHVLPGRADPRARTRYEPIRRSADPGGTTGEDLWTKEILGKLGYPTGDRFSRSRALAATTRAADASDWAVNVFVVDSLNDADGKFVDGRFAYCWIGGPHLVLTYDNQAWGIDRMDMVLRHELLHAFYAFDEYTGSGCGCAEHRGYLDGPGTNCVPCNPSAAACLMINNGDALCAATRRQIGWTDLDGDGVIDVVGEDPDTFLDPGATTWCGPPSVSGVATVVAATNRNPLTLTPRTSISVNRIASVDVRADGAPWATADVTALQAQPGFSAAFPGLLPGAHRLEARAVDDRGNLDLTPAGADVFVAPTAEPVGNTVTAERLSAAGARFDWTPCAGAVRYRVLRAGSPQGPWFAAGETSATAWTDASSQTAYFQVRAVDLCGVESGL